MAELEGRSRGEPAMASRGLERRQGARAADRYRAIFDAANDVILVYDAETYRLIDANAAVRTMYGYEPEEIIGHFGPISEGDPPYSLQDALRWMERAKREGPQVFEWLARSKDGRQFWVEVQVKQAEIEGRNVLLAIVRDVSQRKLMAQTLRDSERRLRRHNAALAALARRLQDARKDVWSIVRDVTETAARTLDVERVGVWLFDDQRRVLRCVDLYQLSTGRHSSGNELVVADYPSYFAALENERTVAAHDALTDPRTREFTESYLAPLGITSLLDAPIWVGGRLIGVVCHEQVGPRRRWSLDERNFAGSIADLLALAFESWQRLQTERELRESERRFRQMAMLLPDVVYEMDENFRLTYANQAGFELLGYTRRDFEQGLTIHDIMPGQEVQAAIARLKEAGRTGRPTTGTYRLRAKDGTEIPCEVHSVAIRDEDGRVIGYRGIARDVREREKMEEAQRMAAVGQVAAGVAHEFNNILAAILGRAELARAAGTREAYERLVDTALEVGARGAEICRNLLQFARPAEPKREPVPVERAIEGALSMAQSQLQRTNVTVRRNYATGERCVLGDIGQLEQVFLNLILNACEAMAPDGGVLTIETEYSVRGKQGFIVVRVSDTGKGIPPEHIDRIFEPFFTTKLGDRAQGQRTGTGLGLSVSQSIIRAHRGSIEVSSAVGVGTTFTIRLPEAPAGMAAKPAEMAGPARLEPKAQRGTVLLVEDETSVREVLEELLEDHGFKVVATGTTDDAVKLLAAVDCDAVVADIVMEGGGAREILRCVQSLDKRPPVIVVTGLLQPEVVQEMKRLGAAKCLQKPFTVRDLVAALDEIIKDTA